MADKNVNAEIDEAIKAWEDWMAGLNLTPTEGEREQKRRDLARELGGEIATLDEVGEGESWDEVAELFADPERAAGTVTLDDYQKLDDKSLLINVPFYVNRWWFTDSDEYGREGSFAVMHCITSRPIRMPTGDTSKVVVTDGSTGIYAQLRKITAKTGQSAKLMVRNGLRVSKYTADTDEGPKAAETFYLT